MRGGRGTGVRRDDVDNRAAVRGDDGINDALDDLRLRDDDDDDENAFAIAIATTDDDVRRRRRQGRWPLRAAKRDRRRRRHRHRHRRCRWKRRLVILAGATFIGGGEAGADRRCRPPWPPPLPASFVARAPIPVVARTARGTTTTMVMLACVPNAYAVDVDNDAIINNDASDAAAMGPPDALAAVVDEGCRLFDRDSAGDDIRDDDDKMEEIRAMAIIMRHISRHRERRRRGGGGRPRTDRDAGRRGGASRPSEGGDPNVGRSAESA